jgi:hypothetical protein
LSPPAVGSRLRFLLPTKPPSCQSSRAVKSCRSIPSIHYLILHVADRCVPSSNVVSSSNGSSVVPPSDTLVRRRKGSAARRSTAAADKHRRGDSGHREEQKDETSESKGLKKEQDVRNETRSSEQTTVSRLCQTAKYPHTKTHYGKCCFLV